MKKEKPKTQLKYSWMYNSLFKQNFKKSDIKKLKEKCKLFERIYNANINKIMKIIPEHFFPWKEEYIPIFMIKDGPVFCDPITIRYDKNPKIMLIRLFHELIHVNIMNKKLTSRKFRVSAGCKYPLRVQRLFNFVYNNPEGIIAFYYFLH